MLSRHVQEQARHAYLKAKLAYLKPLSIKTRNETIQEHYLQNNLETNQVKPESDSTSLHAVQSRVQMVVQGLSQGSALEWSIQRLTQDSIALEHHTEYLENVFFLLILFYRFLGLFLDKYLNPLF